MREIVRILFAKTFGIGNAVMALPALKALRSLYPGAYFEVAVGETSDDAGARQVFGMDEDRACGRMTWRTIRGSYLPGLEAYDLAVLSIPYDGRWQNGIHFHAKRVIDGRTRPDPSTTGLVSWKKHEVEYQMDNIRDLGYEGPIPTCSFGDLERVSKQRRIYVGLGYKKDAAGFWKVKHWGNENYAALIKLLLTKYPDVEIVSSGDIWDIQMSVVPIQRIVNDPRYRLVAPGDMYRSFEEVAKSCLYVGNDTGMMHVAAAAGVPVVGLFFLENSITKSHPWGDRWVAIDGTHDPIVPEMVMSNVEEMMR